MKPSAWSRSTAEEVIAALWAIAAILCFGFNFTFAGWVFAAKALIDGAGAAIFGVKEALDKLKTR